MQVLLHESLGVDFDPYIQNAKLRCITIPYRTDAVMNASHMMNGAAQCFTHISARYRRSGFTLFGEQDTIIIFHMLICSILTKDCCSIENIFIANGVAREI